MDFNKRFMMRFSIILLTYNVDMDEVKLTLKSILEQKFTDYEIVVSDDGSKENHFPSPTLCHISFPSKGPDYDSS